MLSRASFGVIFSQTSWSSLMGIICGHALTASLGVILSQASLISWSCSHRRLFSPRHHSWSCSHRQLFSPRHHSWSCSHGHHSWLFSPRHHSWSLTGIIRGRHAQAPFVGVIRVITDRHHSCLSHRPHSGVITDRHYSSFVVISSSIIHDPTGGHHSWHHSCSGIICSHYPQVSVII
jgi:hypothetical protein